MWKYSQTFKIGVLGMMVVVVVEKRRGWVVGEVDSLNSGRN
jgi:hypothetical protein